MPSILLIRHAQASFGAADYDVLSDTGHRQVQALVAGLARRGLRADAVVCGDLRRQLETAEPCAVAVDVSVRVDPRWNEYGDRDILEHHATVPAGLDRRGGEVSLSSRDFQEILNEALGAWIDAGADGPCRETFPDFQARLRTAMRELVGELGSGQTAIVVSSGGAIATVCAELMGLPPQALVRFNHVSINTGVCKVAVGRGGVSLVSINEHAHLDEAEKGLVTYR